MKEEGQVQRKRGSKVFLSRVKSIKKKYPKLENRQITRVLSMERRM